MVGTSKILTVSYGTFSCTLEGFDDSFDTMKAIAEYFRDLAADDRYFGAEPPQPDADMLARIAEREISRRVDAREENGSVHLRAAALSAPEPAPGGATAAAEAQPPAGARGATEHSERPEPAAPTTPPSDAAPQSHAPSAPATQAAFDAPQEAPAAPPAGGLASHDSVAAKLRRIRAVVSKSERVSDAFYTEDEPADDYDPDSAFAIDDLLRTDRADPSNDAAATPGDAETPATNDDADDTASAAATPVTAADISGAFPPEEAADNAAAPVTPEAVSEDSGAFPPEDDIAEAAPAGEDLDTTGFDDPAAGAPADAAARSGAFPPDTGAKDGAKDTGTSAAHPDFDDTEDEDDSLPEGAEAMPGDRLVTDPGPAPVAPEVEEASEEQTIDEASQDATRPLRARVVKLRRKDLPQDFESGDTDAEKADPETDVQNAPATGLNSSLSAEDEADLARELAEVEAELRAEAEAANAGAPTGISPDDSAETQLTPALEDTAPDQADEPQEPENDPADDARRAVRSAVTAGLTQEDAPVETAPAGDRSAPVADAAEEPHERSEVAYRLEQRVWDTPDDDAAAEDDDDRAADVQPGEFAEAETEDASGEHPGEPEQDERDREFDAVDGHAATETTEPLHDPDRRDDAPAQSEGLGAQIRQLARKTVRLGGEGRALLTSRSVEDDSAVSRLMSETQGKMEEPEVGRRRNAIQHLRAAVAATKAEQELARNDAPADDGSGAYRDDLADVVRPRRPSAGQGQTARPGGASRPAPLKLVAEQRIDTERAAPVQPRRVERPALEVAGKDGGFVAYAEKMGAHRLPDLLEAAAAYLTFVEERDVFSRPQLMTKVRQVQGEEWSREDGLRTFGQLLRDGKIQKIRGGRFSVSDEIGFRPDDAREAG